VRGAVEKNCARFDGDYWHQRDSDGKFPEEFYRAFADDGWLGICIPQAYGGSGLGVTEAALMMQAVARSGAGLSGASTIHMNIFGLNPVAVYASEEQKRRMLPPIAAGKEKACFAVTSPMPASRQRRSKPGPNAAAMSTSSTARRSGFRRRRSPTKC
jgi:acyl-CoA dehydrogenase